ncbi:MAG: hypothetical protein E3K37_17885 [Candidatus Kuenenia sp.]|nr:hypothetical protein [Candidatus Kuenenia hertensis]
MATITKLYPLLKEIGLNDQKSQEFIEIIEDSYHSKIEQEIKRLVTNETFLTETTKLRQEMAKLREEMAKIREEMANMKVELIKWNVGTIIAVAGVVAAIVKLIG